MNAPNAVRVAYESLRSLGFAGIGVNYAAVGTPFSNPIRILKLTNFTDVDLLVSFNGIDDHDVISANGFYLYDYGTNRSAASGYLEQPAGDRLYVKQADGPATLGTVYLTVVYVSEV